MVQLVLFVLGNLAGSFFCSLSEAALLSSSEARIRALIERGDLRAGRLLPLRQDPGRTLASIVFLNNVFAIAGTAAISAYATQVLVTPTAMLVFITLQTILIIAFGEIVPKVLGEARPERIAIVVAPALVNVRRALAPLVWLVQLLTGWARPRHRIAPGEEAEIRELARLGEEGGHIESEQAELIRRVFRLDDITAADVMTPRRLVRALPEDATMSSLRAKLLEWPHGQYPVYRDDLDTVIGVLSLRDALEALVRGDENVTVGQLMKRALFIPTSRKVDDVLKDVQQAHGTMAIVLDEYGVTEGVITMDDLVEELVGEAIDEMDVTAGLVKRVSRDVALVHGLTRARDVARFLHCPVAWASDEQENTTITGLFSDALGRIPIPGDRLVLSGGLELVVRLADPVMAVRVRARYLRDEDVTPGVTPAAPPPAEAPPAST